MAEQHSLFQITSYVDESNVATFTDRTKVTRNPRCGQWVKTAWSDKRARFIGVARDGVICMDLYSGGNFRKFSEKVQIFKRANDPQIRFPWG